MTENHPIGGKIVAAPMPLTRFETLIATYGAAPERWPGTDRPAAEALVERNAQARDMLADAAILDRLLEGGTAPAPSDDLTCMLERRFVDANRTRPFVRLSWRMPSWKRILGPGIAVAAAATVAVMILNTHRPGVEHMATPVGPSLVRTLSPIEIGADGFVDGDGPLEPEIALIDPSINLFASETSPDERLEPELILAGGSSFDELPLD